MLRVTRSACRTSVTMPQRRFAHGVHYGPEEPISYYVKWIAVVGGFGALLAYDRIYSDRAVSKLLTPETDTAAIETQREKFADRQVTENARNVELLFPRNRSTVTETFSPRPVLPTAHRAAHTSDAVDLESLSERRPRTKPHD